MKIHIINILVVSLVFCQDVQIDPVAVNPTDEAQVLPDINPQFEERVFEQRVVPKDPEVRQFEDNFDQLEDNIMENEERAQDRQQRQRMNMRFKPWLSQELQALHDLTDLVTHEVFAFKLTDQYEFRWNPSKKGRFRIVFQVFDYNHGQVNYPQKPDEDDHVVVMAQPQTSNMFMDIGRVYMKRVFILDFYSDYQTIKVKNNYDQSMLIQVSLELTNFVPESGVDDDEFKMSAEKIRSVLNELQDTEVQRQKMYKTEWSFRDREEQHQSQMLVLTGVQLFVILGTAIIQMYCIKSLLDNRLIV